VAARQVRGSVRKRLKNNTNTADPTAGRRSRADAQDRCSAGRDGEPVAARPAPLYRLFRQLF